MHRFVEFAVDLKTRRNMLKMLHPSRKQIEKNCNRQQFGKAVRRSPFPVKEEHATVCSHIKRDKSLTNVLGTIPRQRRDASGTISRERSSIGCSQSPSPGPADYNTTATVANDRPLTSHKSHNTSTMQFNRAKKDTMKVDLYDPAYERSYKNNMGPGPAFYSKMYEDRETDRFRKTAFPK